MGGRAELNGKTMVFALIWVALRRVIQEEIIVQENVPGWPSQQFLERFLPMYEVQWVVSSPTELGQPVSRPRGWTVPGPQRI